MLPNMNIFHSLVDSTGRFRLQLPLGLNFTKQATWIYLLKVSHGRGIAWRLALVPRAKVLGLLGSKYIAG
jgi:hypothetical protein